MIKDNVFRGIAYTFLTFMTILLGTAIMTGIGGSAEMTFVGLYNALSYKGILILAGIIVIGVSLFAISVGNYKKFVCTCADRVKPASRARHIFCKLYKIIIVGAFLAGVTFIVAKVGLVELVTAGTVKTIITLGLSLFVSAVLFLVEVIELLEVLFVKGPKKPKKVRVRRQKRVKTSELPAEHRELVTEKQEKPVFRFGKK